MKAKNFGPAGVLPRAVAAAVLCFFGPTGCRKEQTLPIPVSLLRVQENLVVATTDPQEKNRLLRRRGTRLEGVEAALQVPLCKAVPQVNSRVRGIRVLSADLGIAFAHSQVQDASPCAVKEGSVVRLYFSSGSQKPAIYLVRSPDGWNWSPPRLVVGPSENPQAPDSGGVTDPAVLAVGGRYFLYYAGKPPGGRPLRLFCAVSEDGETWRKYGSSGGPTALFPDTVLAEDYGQFQPSACWRDGFFYLFFTTRRSGTRGLYVAVSRTGTAFERKELVCPGIENADVAWCPALNTFVMVWGAGGPEPIRVAFCGDGRRWDPSSAALVAVGPPETAHHSPCLLKDLQGNIQATTRVFYVGGIPYGDRAGEPTWEIESSWISFQR